MKADLRGFNTDGHANNECGVSEEMHERNGLPGSLSFNGERRKGVTRKKRIRVSSADCVTCVPSGYIEARMVSEEVSASTVGSWERDMEMAAVWVARRDQDGAEVARVGSD